VLIELAVSDLGVIESLRLVLGEGMTALTGETGAGKTMLVEAIDLLVGGKADAVLVRPGADEATVEGRFVVDGDEVVLTRVVPAVGRSRGYVNGRLAPASALAEWGARLVDLHGQHAHQSLLAPATQRGALDLFGRVDLEPLLLARQELARVESALSELGGDERARAREIDLLRFQVDELERARLSGPDEDDSLSAEETLLGDAVAHQEAAAAAVDALQAEGAANDAVGEAIAAIAGRAPFAAAEQRLRSVAAELSDIAAEVRALGEGIEDDPERLAAVRERRQLLHDLRRKYGETLRDVLAYWDETSRRLAELEAHDERAAALDRERAAAVEAVDRAAAAVAKARRAAAPGLASATAEHLGELAMAKAKLAVEVHGEGAGDDVRFLLAANPGAPLLPLAKVASGGELARAMLALRLVLSGTADGSGPPTLVFDEVDAGIGGTAALAVGAALSALAADRQVLVVTHLPQVAVHAGTQVAVRKDDTGTVTTAHASVLDDEERVIELSRMLSGSPDSETARQHATELLASVRARTSE
jgi:DNA repair protein RecN (Recombination protein N)